MLYAVVMAGGIGERFWPLSTPQRPKQLVPLFDDQPLLVQAIERLNPVLPIERVVVVTSRDLENPVRKLVPSLPADNLILEPIGRNTAPAAALASQKLLLRDSDAVIGMFPADHFIRSEEKFRQQILQAAVVAENNYIVTFGVEPDYPATGYGYIRIGEPLEEVKGEKFHRAEAFVEKPDLETAKTYVKAGNYLWNSGIFVWGAKFFMEQVETHAPEIHASLQDIQSDLEAGREAEALERFYGSVERISVDYAIMERSDRIAVMPAKFSWDDLGSWPSLERVWEVSKGGNVVIGDAILNDVKDSIVYAEDGVIALLGVKDLVVVRVGDVTMVCHRKRAEEVRKLAEEWRRGTGKA
jgi:mannose-1-phosphate guanylyltransferase